MTDFQLVRAQQHGVNMEAVSGYATWGVDDEEESYTLATCSCPNQILPLW